MLTTKNATAIVGGSADPLAVSEADKYRRMWNVVEYRRHSPAERQRDYVLDELIARRAQSVLDLGTGTGRLALWLHNEGYDVRMVDIAENCLDPDVAAELGDRLDVGCIWQLSAAEYQSDFVVCIDVLEHIPTERVKAVAEFIRAVAPHGYLQAATFDDSFGSRIGETLHLTVKPAGWWAQFFPDAELTARGSHVDIVF